MHKRIGELRKENDYLQKQVAIEIGITRARYCLYELGRRQMPIEYLAKLAKFYNTSIDYIVGNTDFPYRYPEAIEKKNNNRYYNL